MSKFEVKHTLTEI